GLPITTPDALYIVGGSDGVRHLDSTVRLRLIAGEVVTDTPLPPLPTPAAYGGGGLLGTQILLVGGQAHPAAPEALPTAWSIDVNAEPPSWEPVDAVPAPARMLPAFTTHAGALYVIGGASLHPRDGGIGREYLSDAWRYAPGSGWTELPSLPHPLA